MAIRGHRTEDPGNDDDDENGSSDISISGGEGHALATPTRLLRQAIKKNRCEQRKKNGSHRTDGNHPTVLVRSMIPVMAVQGNSSSKVSMA